MTHEITIKNQTKAVVDFGVNNDDGAISFHGGLTAWVETSDGKNYTIYQSGCAFDGSEWADVDISIKDIKNWKR